MPSANLFKVVLIETHDGCNRKCSFCKFGLQVETPKIGFMSMELFESIASQLQALKFEGRISPFGINEPLMDKRMPEMISLLRKTNPHAWISLVTNGDFLSVELFQQLYANGLSAMGISVYERRNIERFKQYFNDPERPARMIDMIDPLLKLENRGGSVPGVPELPEESADVGCHRPTTTIMIKADGKVVLCCSDMYNAVVMGDLANDSLIDIWDGPSFQYYREELAAEGRSGLSLCSTCSYKGGGTGESPYYPLKQRSRRATSVVNS
jgi:radical SAM protein with 4Fe4S-binding SPASM domain